LKPSAGAGFVPEALHDGIPEFYRRHLHAIVQKARFSDAIHASKQACKPQNYSMLKLISIALFLVLSFSAAYAQDADNESAVAPEASQDVPTPESDNAFPMEESVYSLPVVETSSDPVQPVGEEAVTFAEIEKDPVPHSGSAAESDEILTHRDGYCIRRVIYDNGFTRVTIDALGTLQPMKNNIVEDVEVPCP